MPILTTRLRSPLGGDLPFHLVSAATTNATLVKAGGTLLKGWALTNTNAAIRYIAFHDLGRVPVGGQNVYFKYGIPASGASNQYFGDGIQFFQGLALTLVAASADSDATAVGSGDLLVNLFYV
jgi:hypothetical protein